MGMIEDIVENLKTELELTDENFNETVLQSKVESAYREVQACRNYPLSYSEERITQDMIRFWSNVRGIALYDYNQIGVEGETSHSENGIGRAYVDREKLFSGVIPLSRRG